MMFSPFCSHTDTFSFITKRADTQGSNKSVIQSSEERSQISIISLCGVPTQFFESGKLAWSEQVETGGYHLTFNYMS